jgi:preprotein translocase subunit SecD
MKIKWKVAFLVFLVLLSLIWIAPQLDSSGVSIRSVSFGSVAAESGISVPATLKPVNYEQIMYIDGVEIQSIEDYYEAISDKDSFQIVTNKGEYSLSLTENKTDFGLTVIPKPQTNIVMGLDLAGGVRILLEPERQLEAFEIETMRGALERRLNVFGLSDVRVDFAGDSVLNSNQYFIVEMAGATLSDVEKLLQTQGKFEAKINGEVVFTGEDIVLIEKRAVQGAGVLLESCGQFSEGFACQYQFPITLSSAAAQRQADLTRNLTVIREGSRAYLSSPIQLYLDDVLVTELSISAELQGRATPTISISGSGSGVSREAAIKNANDGLKEMQILLESGNLPAAITIVKADTVSADLGPTFLHNAFFVGLGALVVVCGVLAFRYRQLKIVLSAMFVVIAEIIILLGFSTLVKWNIDLASLAGLIIILGTGVDHLIIIADQVKYGESVKGVKSRIKDALRLIMIVFFTTGVAMLPLLFAGAGILKGFATITLVGLCIAIFITRPAFAELIAS